MNDSTKFTAIFLLISNVTPMVAQSNTMNWEFSNFNKLTFSYKQTMTNNESLGLDDIELTKSYSEISGLLIVEVKNKNSADVILKNVKITTFIKDSLGNRLDTRWQEIPDLVYIKDLKDNGLVEGSYDRQTELFAKILFPIINNAATSGCMIQIPFNTFFDIEGTLVEINGKNTIDFTSIDTEYIKLNTHIFAKKDYIYVAKEKLYVCKIEGESDFKFNMQKYYFTNGNIKLNLLLKQKNEKFNKTKLVVDIDIDIALKLIKID